MNKKTAIALGIFVGLVGIYFATKQGPTKNIKVPMKVEKIENLERIEIDRPKPGSSESKDKKDQATPRQTLVFDKKKDRWRLVKPIDGRLTNSVQSKLAEAFGQTLNTDLHRIEADDLTEYRLDKDNVVNLSLYASGGDKPVRTLRIGKEFSVQKTDATRTYIQDSKGGTIYRAQAELGKLFRKKLDDLRTNKIVDVPSDKISSITITRNNKPAVALSKKDGKWRFDKPNTGFKPSKKQVDSYLRTLSPLQASGFADQMSPKDASLAPADAKIEVSGKKVSYTVRVGQKGDSNYYGKLHGRDQIYSLETDTAQKLLATPSTFRTRVPVSIASDTVEKVRFEGKQTVELAKSGEDNTWTMTTPKPDKDLNTQKIQSIVDSLTSLEVDGYPTAKRGKSAGLGKARVRIFTDSKNYTLLIGDKTDSNASSYYAKFENTGPLFSLSEFKVNRFKPAPDAFYKSSKPKPSMGGGPGGKPQLGGRPGGRPQMGGGGPGKKPQMGRKMKKRLKRKLLKKKLQKKRNQ